VLTAQIRSGAPFDLLLSADTSYPMSLWREGRADTPRVYAFGRLILWTRAAVPLSGGMRALLHPSVRAIAIPNPRNAPYGAAAVEALRASGLYDSVRAKIVYGESVAQVNQYVDTRAAEIGVTASSAPFSGAARGAWAPVDASLYAPIPQGAAVILRSAPDPERAARAFLEFLSTPEAREILRRFGYALP
jgi:molybdate transport system substrate-binding protein